LSAKCFVNEKSGYRTGLSRKKCLYMSSHVTNTCLFSVCTQLRLALGSYGVTQLAVCVILCFNLWSVFLTW